MTSATLESSGRDLCHFSCSVGTLREDMVTLLGPGDRRAHNVSSRGSFCSLRSQSQWLCVVIPWCVTGERNVVRPGAHHFCQCARLLLSACVGAEQSCTATAVLARTRAYVGRREWQSVLDFMLFFLRARCLLVALTHGLFTSWCCPSCPWRNSLIGLDENERSCEGIAAWCCSIVSGNTLKDSGLWENAWALGRR
jgi:hypothetical protein